MLFSVGASKPPSYLQRWDPKSYTIEQAIPISGSLSALATSDNGHFVATGSMFDGTVEIYTAFNLMVSILLTLHSINIVKLFYYNLEIEKGGKESRHVHHWTRVFAYDRGNGSHQRF